MAASSVPLSATTASPALCKTSCTRPDCEAETSARAACRRRQRSSAFCLCAANLSLTTDVSEPNPLDKVSLTSPRASAWSIFFPLSPAFAIPHGTPMNDAPEHGVARARRTRRMVTTLGITPQKARILFPPAGLHPPPQTRPGPRSGSPGPGPWVPAASLPVPGLPWAAAAPRSARSPPALQATPAPCQVLVSTPLGDFSPEECSPRARCRHPRVAHTPSQSGAHTGGDEVELWPDVKTT
mmetsp:Transcript_53339/g.130299  ORF Transcript_53339/g.130299 Transcript_53339/m.130299 type:complete len:240 (-) Transcript_53339:9-728(-)